MDLDIVKALSCDGVAPSGPVSAWPKERNNQLHQLFTGGAAERAKRDLTAGANILNPEDEPGYVPPTEHATKVEVSNVKMARNAAEAARIAFTKGKVSREIYDERFKTCQTCPSFIKDSQRCSKCGCFMKAKAWLAAKPEKLCPLAKWSR